MHSRLCAGHLSLANINWTGERAPHPAAYFRSLVLLPAHGILSIRTHDSPCTLWMILCHAYLSPWLCLRSHLRIFLVCRTLSAIYRLARRKKTGKGVAAGFHKVYDSSIGKQYSSDEIQLAVRLFRVDEVGMKSLNGARLRSMLL